MTGPPPIKHWACPICEGKGERQSPVLHRAITCPWCRGHGTVSQARHQALRAQQAAKRAREAQGQAA